MAGLPSIAVGCLDTWQRLASDPGASVSLQQRFKAPPSPFSGQKQRNDRASSNDSNMGGETARAVLQQRIAAGGNGGAVLRDGSDGSDNGWEEVMTDGFGLCATAVLALDRKRGLKRP